MAGYASPEAAILRVATINIDNIKSNLCYVHELLKNSNILLVQEHWLHRFEVNLLQDLLPSYKSHVKCFDDDQLLPPLHRTVGRAGVMFLWHPRLNEAITLLPDGSTRVIALQIRGKRESLTLVNTYMPANGSRDKECTFEEVLDEVSELFEKFSPTTSVIWGGDLNGSLVRNSSRNDKLLTRFCMEQGLACPPNTPDLPTYHHFVDNINSKIDMFLMGDGSHHQQSSVQIKAREPTNVGPHDPVIINLKFGIIDSEAAKKDTYCVAHPKVNWSKVNLEMYKELTQMRLDLLGRHGFDTIHPEVLVDCVTVVLGCRQPHQSTADNPHQITNKLL